MTVDQIIALAAQHQNEGAMSTSAQVCLIDAMLLRAEGHDDLARRRALTSLQYSVGAFHPDFQQAQQST